MTEVGRALSNRFDNVSRSELVRLRRKTASLTPEQRAVVEALAAEVTQAIAVRLDAGLAASGNDTVGDVVARIFSLQGECS
jgi:DNA-binding MarR family transcriptional regulator